MCPEEAKATLLGSNSPESIKDRFARKRNLWKVSCAREWFNFAYFKCQ
jgi:hypothetical protein